MKGQDPVNYLLRSEMSGKIWLLNIDALKFPHLPFNLVYLADDNKQWAYDYNAEGDGYP